MKMKKEDLERLQKCIDKYTTAYGGVGKLVTDYELGLFSKSELVKDLQLRFCWDIFYKSGALNEMSYSFKDYTDAHIYTALKSILPTVVKQY